MTDDQYTESEQYVIGESQELNIGEADASALRNLWEARIKKSAHKILAVFPALGYRNYRLYFSGQLISFIGTWLQNVAQGWLVFQMTNSALAVGVVAALAAIPTLLFSLLGGVFADRFPQRKLMLISQITPMLCAFAMAGLVWMGTITLWEIGALSFIVGLASALAYPVSQTFMLALVGPKDLSSAIALNSTVFNGARVIGPALAGLSIAAMGAGGTFFINGLTFIAVIAGLLLMRLAPSQAEQRVHAHPLKAIQEGLAYTFSHSTIRPLIILAAGFSVFGWSYATIMPVIAKTVFHQNAAGLGYLYAATGLGALVGALGISLFLRRASNLLFILASGALFVVSLVLFTFTSSMVSALPMLFLTGLGLTAQFSIVNIILQNSVENRVRGRVMSIYSLAFIGFAPFGSMEIGFLTERFGVPFALRSSAFAVAISLVFFFLQTRRIRDVPVQ